MAVTVASDKMQDGLGRTDRLRLFLLQFVGIAAAAALVWLAAVAVNFGVTRQARIDTALSNAQVVAARISNQLIPFSTELFVAARDPSLQRFIAGDPAGLADLAARYRIVAEENQSLTQIRYIDERGRERVRVDRTADGVVVVPESGLQDKSDRYYFIETSKLDDDSLYLSHLDLNVEQGVVVVPWEPTIRLAAPVRDAAGRRRGITIANLNVARMLSMFGPQQGGGRRMLLNRDGYWLAGMPDTRLWGFMTGKPDRLELGDPELWAAIRGGGNGVLARGTRIHAYLTTQPAEQLAAQFGARHSVHNDSIWRIVVEDDFGPDMIDWTARSLALIVPALMIAAFVCWRWSGSTIGQRRADAARLQAEQQLVRNEKMAALGELVAGVAHELNTPIGNAVTVASTMAEQVSAFEQEVAQGKVRKASLESLIADLRTGADIILTGLSRAADLIGKFKQVAVDQASEQRRQFDLDDYVGELAISIQPSLKHSRLQLVTDTASGITLDSYPGAIAQVVINLVNNAAIHGFPEGGKGTITIATAAGDDEAEITVTDNGRGIPATIADRIFDPFFTTRPGKGGSGLGLSIVHNIVHNLLGGEITVERSENHETIFRIVIPRAAPGAAVIRVEHDHVQ